MIHASRVYDSAVGKKVYKQEPFDAAAFVNAVVAGCGGDAAEPFDAAGAKLLVMDGDGGYARLTRRAVADRTRVHARGHGEGRGERVEGFVG